MLAGLAAFSLAYVAPWWPRAGRFPALAGLAAAALSLATPIIFLGAFLAAAKTEGLLATGAGLWGSEASSQSRVTWSAGGAWYSLVIAAALLAFGSVLLVRRRVASPLPTAP